MLPEHFELERNPRRFGVTTDSNVRRVQIKCGKEDLVLETGRMAKQADGSVMVQYLSLIHI